MPAGRVLATQQAKDAANQMLALAGPVKQQVGRVLQYGSILADPHRWDGGLAGKWRNDWDQDANRLRQIAAKLEELEHRAQQVIDDIFKADSTTPGAATLPVNAVLTAAMMPAPGGGEGGNPWDTVTETIPRIMTQVIPIYHAATCGASGIPLAMVSPAARCSQRTGTKRKLKMPSPG